MKRYLINKTEDKVVDSKKKKLNEAEQIKTYSLYIEDGPGKVSTQYIVPDDQIDETIRKYSNITSRLVEDTKEVCNTQDIEYWYYVIIAMLGEAYTKDDLHVTCNNAKYTKKQMELMMKSYGKWNKYKHKKRETIIGKTFTHVYLYNI